MAARAALLKSFVNDLLPKSRCVMAFITDIWLLRGKSL